MHDILDDNFMVSNYINANKKTNSEDYRRQVSYESEKMAREWATDSIRTIILPAENLSDLEDMWLAYNMMIKKHRRESDWKSLELFGMTNQQHYEMQKSAFLKDDIDNDIDNLDQLSLIESAVALDTLDSFYELDQIQYTTVEVEKAMEWAKESNRIIIIPTRTLEELENLWESFNSMIKKHRRESDWMSIELFMVSNQNHYEYLKSHFLREDLSAEDKEAYGSVVENTIIKDKESIVRDYLKEESINAETPIEIVKSLLEMTVPKNGIYEELLTNNVLSDVMDSCPNITSDIVSIDTICNDIPFIDPDDMIDMGVFGQSPIDNYYGVIADNSNLTEEVSVKEWFEMYRLYKWGICNEFEQLSSAWVDKVRRIMFELKNIDPLSEMALRKKQSLLELGWDPDVEFSAKSRLLAREMALRSIKEAYGNTKYIDLRGIDIPEHVGYIKEEVETESGKKLFPVFIVLSEGYTVFSSIIKGVTHTIYSHASISFKPELNPMYSFKDSTKDGRGGFVKENIRKDNDPNKRVGVYAFFVPENIFNKLKEVIDLFEENIQKTAYSYKNIFTFALKIPFNRDWKLICSQFVDRVLKLANIDITNKDSSLVAPADFHKSVKKEKNIYTLYEGLSGKYNPNKISKMINSLITKSKPLKEHYTKYYADQNSYIHGIVSNINNPIILREMRTRVDIVKNDNIRRLLEEAVFPRLEIKPYIEAKEFPVQFDADGNLFIKNLKKINYEEEYAKSHKLLKEYLEAENIDGMKYELSKLWMMSCMIDGLTYSKKFDKYSDEEKNDIYKAKAKILNDFKFYMKQVLKVDRSFNFTEYYNDSPFSSATVKINSTTLSAMNKLIKQFLTSL